MRREPGSWHDQDLADLISEGWRERCDAANQRRQERDERRRDRIIRDLHRLAKLLTAFPADRWLNDRYAMTVWLASVSGIKVRG